MSANLASAENAAKINQRFRELEAENRALAQHVRSMETALAQTNTRLDAMHSIVQQLMAGAFGSGPTETQ